MAEDLYCAEPLRVAQAMRAYPLVSLLFPEVTPASWRTFVRQATRLPTHRGGRIAVTDQRGYCYAIFSYRVARALPAGRALRVSDVVMGRLPGSRLPQAIVAWADRLAGELDTTAVSVDLEDGVVAASDAELLRQSGFRKSGLMLTRILTLSGRTGASQEGPTKGGSPVSDGFEG